MDENLRQAIAYLRANEGQYGVDELQRQLESAGYSSGIIQEALRSRGSQKGERTNVFNLFGRKTYESKREKIFDFAVGFVGAFVLGFFLVAVSDIMFPLWRIMPHFYGMGGQIIIPLVMYMALIAFFWPRRRYIAWGIATAIIGSVVAVAALIVFLIMAFRGFAL